MKHKIIWLDKDGYHEIHTESGLNSSTDVMVIALSIEKNRPLRVTEIEVYEWVINTYEAVYKRKVE